MFHYCLKLPGGRTIWARFFYREIVPPERLVWLNGFSDEYRGLTRNPWAPGLPMETINTLTLVEQDKKTLITITVVALDPNEEEAAMFASAIKGMKVGLDGTFKVLADYLSRPR